MGEKYQKLHAGMGKNLPTDGAASSPFLGNQALSFPRKCRFSLWRSPCSANGSGRDSGSFHGARSQHCWQGRESVTPEQTPLACAGAVNSPPSHSSCSRCSRGKNREREKKEGGKEREGEKRLGKEREGEKRGEKRGKEKRGEKREKKKGEKREEEKGKERRRRGKGKKEGGKEKKGGEGNKKGEKRKQKGEKERRRRRGKEKEEEEGGGEEKKTP